MKTVKMMLTAKGTLPMILIIIRVHNISYVNPVIPDKKKQIKTRDITPLLGLSWALLLSILPSIHSNINNSTIQVLYIIIMSYKISSNSVAFSRHILYIHPNREFQFKNEN
jgi:hypothetical protein